MVNACNVIWSKKRRPDCHALVVAVVGALVFCGSVGAESYPAISTERDSLNPPNYLEPYLDDLDSPDFGVREIASQRMRADDRITDNLIFDYLEANWHDSTAEQISRLEDLARERFAANPGAIGIEFTRGAFAVIESVKPEAPVYGLLHPGDRILKFNGRRLPDSRSNQQDVLFEELSRCKAGEIVKVQIERGREELEVEFPLADPSAIPGFDGYIATIQGYLHDRWREVCQTRLPARPSVVIDMDIFGDLSSEQNHETPADFLNATGARLDDPVYNNELAMKVRERIGQISGRIAEVIDAQESASPGVERGRYHKRYLALRSELARLNARLRMLDAIGNNRRRR